MKFCVTPEIWEDFPGMELVVVRARNVDTMVDRREVDERMRDVAARLRGGWTYPNAQAHPSVAAWRVALRRAGIHPANYPCSIEGLVRRVVAGRDIYRINALVDAYNAASLEHIAPVGAWDVAGERPIELRRTAGGERFTELGATEPVTVGPGEIAYLSGQDVLTRHFLWRQSEIAKITASTTEIFLVSEVLPELGAGAARTIERAFVDMLGGLFGADVQSAVLGAGDLEWPYDAHVGKEASHVTE